MARHSLSFFGILLLLSFQDSCSRSQRGDNSGTATPSNNSRATISVQSPSDPKSAFAPLLNRIWRISNSPYGPPSGAIYIFLNNGTLLETSCVETYRIALWSVEKSHPDALRVVEDQQPAFTASLGEAGGNTLHLHQKPLRSAETLDITLTAIDGEFVCPDLPK